MKTIQRNLGATPQGENELWNSVSAATSHSPGNKVKYNARKWGWASLIVSKPSESPGEHLKSKLGTQKKFRNSILFYNILHFICNFFKTKLYFLEVLDFQKSYEVLQRAPIYPTPFPLLLTSNISMVYSLQLMN